MVRFANQKKRIGGSVIIINYIKLNTAENIYKTTGGNPFIGAIK